MNINDFTSADRVISKVSSAVGDSEFKNGFSKGWYKSHVMDALQELSIESRIFKVIKDYEIPQTCQVKIPKGVFNLREIYLYNGDICEPVSTQVVHWKRLFNNMPDGKGNSARVKDDSSNSGDPFIPNSSWFNGSARVYGGTGNRFYYNIANGILMLSPECLSYKYIRLVFNGLGGEIGDEPVIPRFFERAITDYVEERYYNAMKSRNPRTFRALWNDAKMVLESNTGAWHNAIKRVKSMDGAQQESMNEYISSMFHK